MNLSQTKLNLLTNTSAQFLARLFSASLSFLLSLILIRHLGPSFYGNFVKVTALLFFNNTLVDLGLNALIVRRLAKRSFSAQSHLLNQLFFLRFLLAILVVSLTLIWLFYFHPPHYSFNLKLAYLVGALSVFGFAFYLSATARFQFDLAYFKSALATTLGSLVFFLLSLVVVFYLPKLQFLLLVFSLGYLVTALISFWFSRSTFSFHSPHFQITSTLNLLKDSFWLSLTFIFSSLANKLDIIIASLYRSAAEIGQYGFAYKFFDFAIIFPSLFMNVVYPLLLKRPKSRHQLTLRAGLFLLITSFFILIFGYWAAPLILYLRPGLNLAVSSLRRLLLSLPLFYLTPPLMWHLVALKREKQLALVYFLATLINLSLNFIFVPQFGVLASATITLITELSIVLGLGAVFVQ